MPDHCYVYPAYLGRALPRAQGRRVPQASAAPATPSLEEILSAARALGFQATPEPDRQYPRRFHEYGGRVKVMKKPGISKTRLLRLLAQELRKRGPPPAPAA